MQSHSLDADGKLLNALRVGKVGRFVDPSNGGYVARVLSNG